jgi:hypothetical protein
VVSGAEGERSLDLDGEVVGAALLAIMGAMHQHATCPHRLQALKGSLDPILLRQRQKNTLVGLGAHERSHEIADGFLIGLAREIGFQKPRPAIPRFERCDRGLGRIEYLADQFGHDPRRTLIRGEAEHMGRAVGVQSFEHE